MTAGTGQAKDQANEGNQELSDSDSNGPGNKSSENQNTNKQGQDCPKDDEAYNKNEDKENDSRKDDENMETKDDDDNEVESLPDDQSPMIHPSHYAQISCLNRDQDNHGHCGGLGNLHHWYKKHLGRRRCQRV